MGTDNWISVDDGLPEVYQDVIAFDPVYRRRITRMIKDNLGTCWHPIDDLGTNPTHWIPLPEAPKEEKT